MKFVSWNVNGLRAVLKKGFEDIVKEFDAEVLRESVQLALSCFQRTDLL